jgi:hypothetical protein
MSRASKLLPRLTHPTTYKLNQQESTIDNQRTQINEPDREGSATTNPDRTGPGSEGSATTNAGRSRIRAQLRTRSRKRRQRNYERGTIALKRNYERGTIALKRNYEPRTIALKRNYEPRTIALKRNYEPRTIAHSGIKRSSTCLNTIAVQSISSTVV